MPSHKYLCSSNYGARNGSISFDPTYAVMETSGAVSVINPCADDTLQAPAERFGSLKAAALLGPEWLRRWGRDLGIVDGVLEPVEH